MSIKDFFKKSKSFLNENNDIFIAIVIILVAFSSFGLGRLSKVEENGKSIRIENMTASVVSVDRKSDFIQKKKNIPLLDSGGLYIGSKNGSKYYFSWCFGVKRIKKENRIIFSSLEKARSAGYSPAGNCKGLH